MINVTMIVIKKKKKRIDNIYTYALVLGYNLNKESS